MNLKNWGASLEEVRSTFSCDALEFAHDDVFHRAIDVAAPAPLAFRWLCQLRVAPYSYDLVDNFGRRSPPHLTPGLADLQAGQRAMIIFRIASFNTGRDLTLKLGSRLGAKVMGDFAGTYRVDATSATTARIVARVYVRYPAGAYGNLLRRFMPFFRLRHVPQTAHHVTPLRRTRRCRGVRRLDSSGRGNGFGLGAPGFASKMR